MRTSDREPDDDTSASLEEQNASLRQLNDGLQRELDCVRSRECDGWKRWTRALREAQTALERKENDVGRLQRQLLEETSARRAERQRADQQQQQTDQDYDRLQRKVKKLKKQLQEQTNRDCDHLQPKVEELKKQADINASLAMMIPQMRILMEAWERRTEATPEHVDLAADAGMVMASDPIPSQSAQPISSIMERDLLLEQATDAATTMQYICRRNVMEREAVLTCPISLDLLEDPVVTECCGKTFSSEALAQAGRRNSACPFCRSHRVVFHPNRDVEKLVEIHRAECQVLGIQEVEAPRDTSAEDGAVEDVAQDSHTTRSTNARRSQHREQRNQRVQARSEVPRRRSSRLARSTDTAAVTAISAPIMDLETAEPTITNVPASAVSSVNISRNEARLNDLIASFI